MWLVACKNSGSLLQIRMDCFLNCEMYQNKPNCIHTNQTNIDMKGIAVWKSRRHEGLNQASSTSQKRLAWFCQQNYEIPHTVQINLFYLSLVICMEHGNRMLLDPPVGLFIGCVPLWNQSLFHFEYGAQEMKYKRSFLTDHGFTFFPFFPFFPLKRKNPPWLLLWAHL